ncbi:MAG: FAD-binding protein [Candidatus Aminicenantes bacterium]|nr:FAD-binding protein [Candidatus Aminicenantes bacterium]
MNKGRKVKNLLQSDAGNVTNAADEALKTAGNCRHYAMCKIDFLGSGVCAPGLEKHYASFYPVGRMDLYQALAENKIPITGKCVEIADSCNLCGKCDYQCYFVNEMRPTIVMKALKEHVGAYLKNGGKIAPAVDDSTLTEMKKIVGDYWATNDPAIRITYHHDLCPHVVFKMPEYVVMPNSKEEISALIKLLNTAKIPYIVRGNGASSHGLVFSEGAIIDLNRMKTMDFDEKNWFVKVGPGIAAFDLQREAQKRGFRVHTAEPAALVCANIMTSGMLSTFSTTYGISADNYIDAEFVARDGSFFSLNEMNAPNLFSFRNTLSEIENMAICVSVSMKLHPVTDDESGVLVPFDSLGNALDFVRDCAIRHIGLSIGILGSDFVSSFLAPTKKLASEVKDIFAKKLGMTYLVLLIGDKYALRSVKDMGVPVIDQPLFRTLALGIPALKSGRWLDLLRDLSDDEPFSYLRLSRFAEFAETALAPSPDRLAQDIDPDLRPFFVELYSRPEMTDLAWLTTTRISSARIGREKPFVALVFYLPIDNSLISKIQNRLKETADRQRIKSALGFITPFDNGKRCVVEYDYYFDHNDPTEVSRVRQATQEAGAVLDEFSAKTGVIRQVRYVVNQGCCRKENLLYS